MVLLSVALFIVIVISLYIVNVEQFFLVYWKEEEMVSVHPKRELLDEVRNVGEWCTVLFGKKPFKGKIAAIGTYSSML